MAGSEPFEHLLEIGWDGNTYQFLVRGEPIDDVFEGALRCISELLRRRDRLGDVLRIRYHPAHRA